MKRIFSLFTFLLVALALSANGTDSVHVAATEFEAITNQIVQLESIISVQSKKTGAVNTRIDDLYTNLGIWVVAIITLLLGLLLAISINARGVARKQVREEMEEIKQELEKNVKEAKQIVADMKTEQGTFQAGLRNMPRL